MKSKILIGAMVLVPALIIVLLGLVVYLVWPRPELSSQQQESMMGQGMMGQGMMGQGRMGQGMMMGQQETTANHEWSAQEIEILRSLWIGSLPPLPPDPSNQYADNPQAAALGHTLFFDPRFSSNGQVSCATCHLPELMFTDGRALAVGVGVAERKTMTIVGTAYSPWLFWDGRADSQWAQALGPLENPVEHGGTRAQFVHFIDQYYREAYEAVFGALPDLSDTARFPLSAGPVENPEARAAWEAMNQADRDTVNRIYANIGKAIAAYERLILPGPSRFDTYVEALLEGDKTAMEQSLNADEVSGLRLFIGDANCIQCHNGPLFTDNAFHNTGVPPRSDQPPDPGRQVGLQKLLQDEFNCLGPYSDAKPEDCPDLQSLADSADEMAGSFRGNNARRYCSGSGAEAGGRRSGSAGPYRFWRPAHHPAAQTAAALGAHPFFIRCIAGEFAPLCEPQVDIRAADHQLVAF
jgi:cytochrome c peroxidase